MGRQKILVLDDQVMYGRSLARALRVDYEIVVAADIAEAERHVGTVDCALVDIRLDAGDQNNRDGLTFVRKLRQAHPGLVIVAMTALTDADLGDQAAAEGANHFLTKPIEISTLKSILKNLLGN